MLEIRRVSVAFRGLRALDGVTGTVPDAGVTALIGPNGAGKTTLLNCIAGTCRHRGEIVLDGRPLHTVRPHRRVRRGVARTYQTPLLMDELSVLDNVMLGGHVTARGWPAGRGTGESEIELRRRALRVLDRLGMAGLAGCPAGGLAHADRRRVETARALMCRPRLLLLDEPSSGLDDGEAAELIGVACEGASTCLLVSHDLHLVTSTARHVVVLSAGAVICAGTPSEVTSNPAVREAFLGDGWADGPGEGRAERPPEAADP
jgi:branched-chain amino acid transport system ATP-binding protein